MLITWVAVVMLFVLVPAIEFAWLTKAEADDMSLGSFYNGNQS